ncbi:MAG: ComEC/Rec2 family competence protein [Clostridia bacterium]|nr:ComEC/Rec2 family competence protein [Clostridia bacterium]
MSESADKNNNQVSKRRLINYRPLFEFALGMMAGIVICAPLGDTLRYVAAAVLGVVGIVLVAIGQKRLGIIAISALLGLTLAFGALPKPFYEGTAELMGVISDIEDDGDKTVLILTDAAVAGTKFNKRVRLTLDASDKYEVGDGIMTVASVKKPSRKFGTYDEFKVRLASGVGCVAQAKSAFVESKNNLPVKEFIVSVRLAIIRRIKSAFGDDSAVFSALLVGDRSELTDERYAPFRASGTAHLLAISGFHVGIIAGVLIAALKRLKSGVRTAIIAALLLFYCALTAFTPGVVRASIMLVALMCAGCFERRGDQLSALSLAAILILAVNPYQIYSLGFQLSFAAVFGIALYMRQIGEMFHKAKLGEWLSSSAAVCISATLGTLALQIRAFSAFSPYTLISNLVAVPAFSVIVVLGLISTVLAFIYPPAAQMLAYIPRTVLNAAEWALGGISSLPYASLSLKPLPILVCAIYLAVLFILSEYILRPIKKRLCYAAALITIFTIAYVISIIIV